AASFGPLAALAGVAVDVALLAGVLAGAEELVPFDEPPQPVALSAARIAASETRLPIRRGFAVGPAWVLTGLAPPLVARRPTDCLGQRPRRVTAAQASLQGPVS